jgi:acetylornithine deacetylase/succinyl-diaminopimelate desuccinylase-like protein
VAGGLKADLAIVGEPTRSQVVTAHKGTLWLELETRGKSAHGSSPDLGRNAVHAMARVVDLLQTDYATQLSRRRHPLLGCATISVGAICGGSQANIVPDRCTILIDRRSLPGETEASVRREIVGVLRRKNLTVTFTKDRLPPCLPLETDPRRLLVARFLKTVGQRKPLGVRYFSDASVLGHGGIPSVVFGPGDIAQAHTADEWISLAALERGKGLLLRFLQSFS